MMKKTLAIMLVIALLFVGCSSTEKPTTEEQAPLTNEEPKETDTPEETPTEVQQETSPEGEPFKIGIIQLVQHDALDATRTGFIDGLAEAGYVDGENIIIDYQNAQGEITNTSTIASKFVNDKVDLILAIATPAAQAVVNVTEEIPILFSAVTDPVDAGLVESNEKPGANVTGTSDKGPIAEQIGLIPKFVPNAKVVGVLFASNEANSYIQAAEAKEEIEALGMEYKEFTVSEPTQIQQVVQTAAGECDVLFSSTDNTIAAAMVQVSTIAAEKGVPVVTGEQGQVEKGAIATYGISYYNLGKMTAAQAVEILEGKSPSDIPVGYATEYELILNKERIEELGLTIPEGLE